MSDKEIIFVTQAPCRNCERGFDVQKIGTHFCSPDPILPAYLIWNISFDEAIPGEPRPLSSESLMRVTAISYDFCPKTTKSICVVGKVSHLTSQERQRVLDVFS